MNKKILLSAAIVFMLMLIGIFSNNAYAMTVDGITGGLNKTTNGTNWGIEVVLPQKVDAANIAKLSNDQILSIIDNLKTTLLPDMLQDVDLASKVEIPDGNVGTGKTISVLNRAVTVILYGDVTGDGIVAEFDAKNVLEYANGIRTNVKMQSEVNQKAANVVGANGIDEMDASKILKFCNALDKFDKEVKDVVTTNYAATLNGKDITVEVSEAVKDEKVVDLVNKIFTKVVKVANEFVEDNTAQTMLDAVENKMSSKKISELTFSISSLSDLSSLIDINKKITINNETTVQSLWDKYNNFMSNSTYANVKIGGLYNLSPINCKLTAKMTDTNEEKVLMDYNIIIKNVASKLPQSGN